MIVRLLFHFWTFLILNFYPEHESAGFSVFLVSKINQGGKYPGTQWSCCWKTSPCSDNPNPLPPVFFETVKKQGNQKGSYYGCANCRNNNEYPDSQNSKSYGVGSVGRQNPDTFRAV